MKLNIVLFYCVLCHVVLCCVVLCCQGVVLYCVAYNSCTNSNSEIKH